jgi:hypothetical protein
VLTGVPTSKRGSRINHLLFADDCLFFCKADLEHWDKLSNFLKIYETTSRQKLNALKTAIYFSLNTPDTIRQQIFEASRVPSS